MSELKAKGITKKYGTKEVLHGIDLTLEKGKISGQQLPFFLIGIRKWQRDWWNLSGWM